MFLTVWAAVCFSQLLILCHFLHKFWIDLKPFEVSWLTGANNSDSWSIPDTEISLSTPESEDWKEKSFRILFEKINLSPDSFQSQKRGVFSCWKSDTNSGLERLDFRYLICFSLVSQGKQTPESTPQANQFYLFLGQWGEILMTKKALPPQIMYFFLLLKTLFTWKICYEMWFPETSLFSPCLFFIF